MINAYMFLNERNINIIASMVLYVKIAMRKSKTYKDI